MRDLATLTAHRLWDRKGYLLSLLPMVTDWIDTGHLPQHPREFATELVVGLVILVGVRRLYARAEGFRRLAQTDALTGLGNRASFTEQLRRAVRDARRTASPLSLAYLDVDNFKQINDTQGHLVGDRLLCEVARRLELSVRKGVDSCYRLGGDEFAVLVVGLEGAAALDVLRRGFSDPGPSEATALQCSVGVAHLWEHDDAEALVVRADSLMYAAKSGEGAHGTHTRGSFGALRFCPWGTSPTSQSQAIVGWRPPPTVLSCLQVLG